MTVKTQ